MKSINSIFFVLICIFTTSCANSAPMRSTITLILPDAYRGEVFLIASEKDGQDWKKADLLVPPSGIAAVRDLPGLAKITPDRFRAKYTNGKKLGNSVLKTGEEISLWPLDFVRNELLYLVVGTFHDKTMRENERIDGDWGEVIAKLKGRK